MNFIFWLFIIAAVLIFIIVVSLYNTLISRRNGVKYAYSSIDALLKKRFDLIPKLVSAAVVYSGIVDELNLNTRIWSK